MKSFDILNIYTKEDADTLLSSLEDVLNQSYNVKTTISELLDKTLPHETKLKILELAKINGIDITSAENLQVFVKEIKTAFDNYPVVTLHLAFPPFESTIENISNWLSTNLKQSFLLEFVIDKALLGGAIVEQNGKYKDVSLKKYIELIHPALSS